MTALALPGRETGPDAEREVADADPDVVVVPDTAEGPAAPAGSHPENAPTATTTVTLTSSEAPGGTIDLTFRRPKAPASDQAGQASWVFGLALALLSEGAAERVVMAEVLAEAAGRSRAIEGAYGRAVALLSEYPSDPLVQRTVDLLAKALLRSRRPSRSAEEA